MRTVFLVTGENKVKAENILRKVEEINEKAKAFIDFLFRRDMDFRIEEKKIILEIEKNMVQFAELFKDKFKDILGLDLSVVEKKDEKKEGKKEIKEKSKEKSEEKNSGK